MRPDGLVHSDGPAILAGSDAPSLQVPDGFDIFSAQFSRDGDDLVIAANGSPPLTVIDYFTVDSPPALEMPNGTMLTGDVVELLAGPRAPGQYAQADAPVDALEGAEAIGRVETLSGTSTATRVSGETVELAQGDPVFRGDVVETAGDSTLGLRLEDGTLASMSSQSRLVLNEFVFETGGSDNWMLVNLVEGAFAFLTGAIAPSGGMEITTPVAVMAIRGTMPVAFISGDEGATEFFAASDKDYELLHLTTREILGIVSSAAGFSLSSPDAPLETIELDPETQSEIDGLLQTLNDAAAELGLLGIEDGSGFHTYSAFGSIGTAQLIAFLLLLDDALAQEAVLEVRDPDQFLMAEAELIANPDHALTDELEPVIIHVLDNDFHPDGDDLTVVSAHVPNGQGSVTIVDGQYLVYDPGTDFDYLALNETTDVVITYVVADSTGAIASTTATVTLTGVNQAPVIAPVGETSLDEQTDTQPLDATIAVTFTDVDLNNVGHSAAVVGVAVSGEDEGLTLDAAGLMALVSPGTVIKNAGESTGSVDFFFTAAYTDFDYLAEGEIVTLTYTFEIDDGDGGTTQQTFDVTITGTNDIPVISGVSSGAVTEDAHPVTLTTGGALTIVDPDAGQSSFVPQTDVAGTYGTFTLLADGTWSYSADNTQDAIQQLGAGESVTDSFTAWSFDATASQTVTVTIHGTNDAPVIVPETTTDTGALTELEDQTGSDFVHEVDGTIAFDDVDLNDTHSAGVEPDGTDYLGSFTLGDIDPVSKTVSWSFSVVDADIDHLPEGEIITQTYTVTIDDGKGGTVDHVVTITITGTNDAPQIIVGDGDSVSADLVEHDDPLDADGTLTVRDVSVSDVVTARVVEVEASGDHHTEVANEVLLGFMTVSSPVIGSEEAEGTLIWEFHSTGEAFDFLADGEELVLVYTIEVDDGIATTSFDVTITIAGTNDAPVITVGSGDSAEAGLTESDVGLQAQGTLSASDIDISDEVTATVEGVAATGDFSGEISVPTLAGFLTVSSPVIADGNTAGTLTWFFNSGNEAFDFLAKDERLVLTYTVKIDDGNGGSDTQDIVITITGTNDAPVIDVEESVVVGTVVEAGLDADQNTVGDQIASGQIAADDVDNGAVLTYSVAAAVGVYGAFAIDAATGAWTYTLDEAKADYLALGESRVEEFTVTVTDEYGATDEVVVTIKVIGSNDAPVISVIGDNSDGAVLTADEATPTSFLLSAAPGNPGYTEGDIATVTFSITRKDGSVEVITLDVVMGPSHALTLPELVDRINAEDNGLQALYTHNAWQFTLFVSGGALDADDITVTFHNPVADWTYTFGVEVLEPGSDAEGLSASGTLSVSDVDAIDMVNASVLKLAVSGSGENSLPDGLDTDAFLAMMSVGTNPVIGSGDTTGSIEWMFDSGTEAFGFLDPNATLILTYTIAATDSAGAVTEHEVTITIYGAGSETQLLASSSDLESSSALMTSTETFDDDSGGEVFLLTETDLSMDDVIIDYQEGDVIDLTQLGFELATGQLNADAAAEYVTYDSGEGVLLVDMDGAGDEAEFEAVAEFVTPPPSILVRLSDGDSTADIEIA